MGNKFIILTFLIFISENIYSQDEFKVVRNTYLKSNPDQYSNNIMQIPQGTIVTKKSNSDYPYILLSFNNEIGYISKIDLESFNTDSESDRETLPLEEIEEPKVEKLKETQTSEVELFKSKLDAQEVKKKTSLVPINFLSSSKWNNKYLWGLLILPIVFLFFILNRFLKSNGNNKDEIQPFTDNNLNNLPANPLEISRNKIETPRLEKKYYANNVFVIFLCVVFFPVGLYILWKNNDFSKSAKIVVTSLISLVLVLLIVKQNEVGNKIDNSTPSSLSTSTTKSKSRFESNPVEKVIDSLKIIGADSNYTNEMTKSLNEKMSTINKLEGKEKIKSDEVKIQVNNEPVKIKKENENPKIVVNTPNNEVSYSSNNSIQLGGLYRCSGEDLIRLNPNGTGRMVMSYNFDGVRSFTWEYDSDDEELSIISEVPEGMQYEMTPIYLTLGLRMVNGRVAFEHYTPGPTFLYIKQ
jgi:hypothetical protein